MKSLDFTKKHWPINNGYPMRVLPNLFAWNVRLAYIDTTTLIREEINENS